MVDRGEGYITLKVLEKLSDSIQEMGQVTSSAIKENAYVTQVELKRMQLQHLVSLEEMKVSSLQAELRAAKRRAPANVTITPEIVDIVLQDNDSRMHIRSLTQEIAHLDPGWAESLEVFRQDVKLLDQAIDNLTPFSIATAVENRLVEVNSEKRKAVAAYNQLEMRLLRRDLESLSYPPFDQLTMDQMGELLEKIPGDIARLRAGETSEVKEKLIGDLNETLSKIKAFYPRKKLESLVGPVPSLDYSRPFPESPEALQPMIAQVNADLEKVNALPRSAIRIQFNHELNSLLTELSDRASKNLPVVKKKKRKWRGFLIALLVILGLACLLFSAIFVTALIRTIRENGSSGLSEQVNGIVTDNDNGSDGSANAPGQFEDYHLSYVEVTASTTFLRETPSTDSAGTYKVVQGDILIDLAESGLEPSWYKVETLDGSATGYLVRDWVNPFSVDAIPGDSLGTTMTGNFYLEDFSTESSSWPIEEFDDEYATGFTEYISGHYVIDLTSNDYYVYRYGNQTVEDLPEEYIYSLTLTAEDSTEGVYYGIQVNVAGDDDFDALLLAPDGAIKILAVRNNMFTLLYDSAEPVNTMAAFNPGKENILSMRRSVETATGAVVNDYALNDQVLARISYAEVEDPTQDLGILIYLNDVDSHARIVIDNLWVDR